MIRVWCYNQINILVRRQLDTYNQDNSMHEHIPTMLIDNQNVEMIRLPSHAEVRNMVFKLNDDSACQLDGFCKAPHVC